MPYSLVSGKLTGQDIDVNLYQLEVSYLMANQQNEQIRQFGTEHLGRLSKVLLHRPTDSIKLINQHNYQFYLFNEVPDYERYLEEHLNYAKLLQSLGIEVFEISNYVQTNTKLLRSLPNLTYLHDSSVVTKYGALLSKMCQGGRQNEELVVKEGLQALGIPIFYEFGPGDQFEGCLILSPETLIIVDTERHTKQSIEKFLPYALTIFQEILLLEVPQERRYMHGDMLFNRISPELALVYSPAIIYSYLITRKSRRQIDFSTFMLQRGIELVNISDTEQQNWGCSFVPLEPNKIIHYDFALNLSTQNLLSRKGVEIIPFRAKALLSGGGSLRCLTLRLARSQN